MGWPVCRSMTNEEAAILQACRSVILSQDIWQEGHPFHNPEKPRGDQAQLADFSVDCGPDFNLLRGILTPFLHKLMPKPVKIEEAKCCQHDMVKLGQISHLYQIISGKN